MVRTIAEQSLEAAATRPDRAVQHWRSIRRVASLTALALGVVVAAILVWSQLPGNRDRCCLGRTLLVVGSGSMTPAIDAGDLIIVRRIDSSDVAGIAVGSVVSFRVPARKSMIVTHRVIGVERSAGGSVVLRTKGDANEYPDSFVIGPDDLVGELAWRVPRLGRVVLNLRTWHFVIPMLIMLVLARMASALWVRAVHDPAQRNER